MAVLYVPIRSTADPHTLNSPDSCWTINHRQVLGLPRHGPHLLRRKESDIAGVIAVGWRQGAHHSHAGTQRGRGYSIKVNLLHKSQSTSRLCGGAHHSHAGTQRGYSNFTNISTSITPVGGVRD